MYVTSVGKFINPNLPKSLHLRLHSEARGTLLMYPVCTWTESCNELPSCMVRIIIVCFWWLPGKSGDRAVYQFNRSWPSANGLKGQIQLQLQIYHWSHLLHWMLTSPQPVLPTPRQHPWETQRPRCSASWSDSHPTQMCLPMYDKPRWKDHMEAHLQTR